ncbi:MOSC and FAD-binding oxidoreductase domain-containing protein [Mycolicibacterium stellerae]|uniref:MOSC and FAD-binding oxidoreductase domain-containing protein n=1 Tax=Mycolicibacterium stellerae TaxID=2358193 RepID=UPI000F0B07CC|nr:MOSC and FAD-binding oxidoreductase domain-containing protein [Mycolicibacterium stellerae]
MPTDVAWRGKTVYTGIYKSPVPGPVMVRRLNIDGDGQGDLGGHGGEQRAVMVYQTESYDYWSRFLGRDDLQPGNFGENFTITGLGDHEVCIGDRYAIGDAEFEVTQPRVTCFRVGMRLGEPDMPNLLVAHHRPGFYFRVITEGRVQAGDAIVRTRRGRHELTVADIDALLYLPDRDSDLLREAVDVPALSPGWQQSFNDLLAADQDASGVTEPVLGVQPGWSGFRPLRVTGVHRESPSIMSIRFEADDGVPLPVPLPGQYLTLRLPDAGDPAPLRSYSLSGYDRGYRISVKREDRGVVSRWLHTNIRDGSVVDVAAPRGDFYLTDGDRPVVLLSAGVGVTPVLAMLQALAEAGSTRDVWWLHTTRDAHTQAFEHEVSDLIARLPSARQHVFYTSSSGRLDGPAIAALGLPGDAAVYMCGPVPFMVDMRTALTDAGIETAHIYSELFGALPPINPGIVDKSTARPHAPAGPAGTGPAVSFSRSGLTVNWSSQYGSILEFAEACDVPTRFSCRSGVCHTCVTPLIAGSTAYTQPPLEEPADGTVLICVAEPADDVVLDL